MTSIRLLAPTAGFGLQLLKHEVKSHKGDNVLVSPASVSLALAMTMNGARGETQTNMERALALPNYGSLSTTNLSYANLLAELSNNEALGVELAVANAIWANKEIEFQPEFLDTNKANFRAQVTSADFAAPQTLTDINDWVSGKTKKRIPTIIDEISPDKIMFLLNAVYFKGEWNVKFNKALTEEQDFHTPGGTKKHPLMKRFDEMVYARGENYAGVKLPFGEQKRISLIVLLPNADTSVDDFVQGLTEDVIRNLAKSKWETEGTLLLPRFEVEYDVELNETLKTMGMADAFDSASADFSGMAKGDIYISEVKHKTFAKFDEEGGEAAAATSVGISLESCIVSQPWELRVDRPFVAALYDESTGTLLFAGVVNDPK